MKREIEFLENSEFDCVVIGGGIQGAGIAREMCLQGLKTLLIDRGDFASGTSSRSTKLVHGGLRYLEHGRVRLVKESLKERRVLMNLMPHLVKPLPFLFPVFKEDKKPLWQIQIGISLYDFLAKKSKFKPHKNWSSKKIASIFPDMKKNGLSGGCLYWDAQMDDARACLETLKAAFDMGATVLNYARLVNFSHKEGKIDSATIRDLKTGREFRVKGKVFINAGGVWADSIRQLADGQTSKKVRMSKGIHIVTKRLFEAKEDSKAIAIAAPSSDGRIFFVVPWLGGTSLIGTTDSDFSGKPSECYALKEEIEYLFQELKRVVPDIQLGKRDVYTSFTGLRALVEEQGVSSEKLSREYEIEELECGLISVLGGKYTTFRSLAEKVMSLVLKKIGKSPRYEDTSILSLNGLIQEDEESLKERVNLNRRAKYYELGDDIKDHLWQSHGRNILEIFKLLDYDPDLKERIVPYSPVIKAEVVYAIKDEMVLTLTDFLRRRSLLFFSPSSGLDLLDAVAKIYQDYLHWSDEEIERQKQEYRAEVRKNTAVLDKILG